MSTTKLDVAYKAAQEAVLEAGKYLASRYASVHHEVEIDGTHEKIPDDVVAENIILETLKKHLKDFSYISEETQQESNTDITFIIDPIEGTTNYLRSIPLFATQIAIVYQGDLVAGLVYEPVKKTLYHARRGEGFFVNEKQVKMEGIQSLQLSTVSLGTGSKAEQKQKLFTTIVPELLPHIRSVRLYGSTGLEMAYVAQNALQAHLNYQSKVYDYAAGVVLVREAGGIVLNFEGNPWTLQDRELIASTSTRSREILQILKRT